MIFNLETLNAWVYLSIPFIILGLMAVVLLFDLRHIRRLEKDIDKKQETIDCQERQITILKEKINFDSQNKYVPRDLLKGLFTEQIPPRQFKYTLTNTPGVESIALDDVNLGPEFCYFPLSKPNISIKQTERR